MKNQSGSQELIVGVPDGNCKDCFGRGTVNVTFKGTTHIVRCGCVTKSIRKQKKALLRKEKSYGSKK